MGEGGVRRCIIHITTSKKLTSKTPVQLDAVDDDVTNPMWSFCGIILLVNVTLLFSPCASPTGGLLAGTFLLAVS